MLEKYNNMKERALNEIAVTVAAHEKARQRIRFKIGQAILDDPNLSKSFLPLFPESLIDLIKDYQALTEEITSLRNSSPK